MTRSLRIPLLAAVLAVSFSGGCKNRDKGGTLSELRPPKDAQPWESGKAIAFDDAYTPTAINLQGRAPNDVTDQQLFQARLGHADIVMLVRIEQVWGRGRYQGRQDQFVEVEIGEFLLGKLPKDAPERLLIEVGGVDELPGALKGEIMLLFLRWDVESEPPYHHHLMPADDELVALIKAMVKHAQDEGVLNAKGDETNAKKRGRKGKRKGRRKGDDKAAPDSALEVDAPSASGGGSPIGADPALAPGGQHDPGEPPAPTGPKPDDSTGLQNLGDDTEPAPE
ncbi:hypothetical protein [Enhygromyxa salina]|nr:hypothetical protein [Enhygromyxa salina]